MALDHRKFLYVGSRNLEALIVQHFFNEGITPEEAITVITDILRHKTMSKKLWSAINQNRFEVAIFIINPVIFEYLRVNIEPYGSWFLNEMVAALSNHEQYGQIYIFFEKENIQEEVALTPGTFEHAFSLLSELVDEIHDPTRRIIPIDIAYLEIPEIIQSLPK